LRKIGSGFSSRFRLVDWLVFFATGKCEGQAGEKAGSDPVETEKIALGLEERLHRAIIDMFVAKRVARQFWNPRNDEIVLCSSELSHEFHCYRILDVAFVMRFRQKSSDSIAAHFAIIASKFVHIHADELPS
jgi:hypothetical protein